MGITRRDLLRTALQGGVGAAIGGPIAGSTVLAVYAALSRHFSDSSAVSSQKSAADAFRGERLDIAISGVLFKLFGVSHTRQFAEENYNTIDTLVKDAAAVVLEAKPDIATDPLAKGTAKSYFGTVINMCHMYSKPIVFIDNLSLPAYMIETGVGSISSVNAVTGAFRVANPSQTRREFLRHAGWLSLALYSFFSSTFSSGPMHDLLADVQEKLFGSDFGENYVAPQKYLFNHAADQRNVELAERLLALPSRLSPEELSNGRYVLVNFGVVHTAGAAYYLSHPFARSVKSRLYGITYGLIDSNEQSKFIPKGNGWEKVEL